MDSKESMITVKFKTKAHDIKEIEALESLKFSELIKLYFEECNINFEENKEKISFQINSTEQKLEWNSDLSIKDLQLKPDDFILRIDSTIINKNEERETREKNTVVDENTDKNIKESFPEILADITLFTERCYLDADEGDDYIRCEKVLEKVQKDKEDNKDRNDYKYDLLLGLIGNYLEEELECEVYINIKKNNGFSGKEKSEGVKTIRYLSTGLITKSKTIVSIGLDDELNDRVRKEINGKFKNKLKANYPKLLTDNNFIVTNIGEDDKFKFFIIPLIPFKEEEFELKENEVNNWINYNPIYKKNSYIEQSTSIINHIVLNKSFLYPSQNLFYKNKSEKIVKRGGEDFIPPYGWWKVGILAKGYYGDDNNWLTKDNTWAIAYSGLRKKEIEEKIKNFENDEDKRHPGEKVGLGVAVYQNPKDMEEDCQEIKFGDEIYKIGFMLRIDPNAIRIPVSGGGKYWVVKGTKEDLRPYGILSKKIK